MSFGEAPAVIPQDAPLPPGVASVRMPCGLRVIFGEIRPNGKRKRLYLGLFTDPVLAARAYDAAALRYFGDHAAPNFPVEAPPESPPESGSDRGGAVFASGGRP